MKPFHRTLTILLLGLAPLLAAGCNKEQIEDTCEAAAIHKCGTKKSLAASACRGAVMSVCVKKLCALPFNQCAALADDPLCSANDCNEPDDTIYPDDDTWSYCGPEGYFSCDDQECTLTDATCPV